MFDIVRYSAGRMREWNAFVFAARNATFLIDRNYMDYHSGRFADHSLMFYKGGALYAVMPANESGGVLYSHQALPTADWLWAAALPQPTPLRCFRNSTPILLTAAYTRLCIRPYRGFTTACRRKRMCMPFFAYAARSSQPATYRRPYRRHMAEVERDRRYGVNKALRSGVEVAGATTLPLSGLCLRAIWAANTVCARYTRWPRCSCCTRDFLTTYACMWRGKTGACLAATVLYLTPQVVHAQYISACTEGKQLRVIDAIYDVILNRDFIAAHLISTSESLQKTAAACSTLR